MIIRVSMLNSNPCKGRKASMLPMPRRPNNPNAQEEQAGTRTLMMIAGNPRVAFSALLLTCLFTRKTLKATTTPAKRQETTSKVREKGVKLVPIPKMRAEVSFHEKLFSSSCLFLKRALKEKRNAEESKVMAKYFLLL